MSALRESHVLDTVQHQTERQTKRQTKRITFLRHRTGLWIACILFLAVGGPLAASAEYLLGTAKTAGQVGEKLDGYLELIDQDAPAEIKKMVKDTNERRLARYEIIAKKRETTAESVGKRAAVKIIERAKPGEMIQTAKGKWTKK